MQAYIFLLNKIADKIPDKDDKLFLKNNINEIAKDLFNFSYLSSPTDCNWNNFWRI